MLEKLEKHLANLTSENANTRAPDFMTMASYAYVISACQMCHFLTVILVCEIQTEQKA